MHGSVCRVGARAVGLSLVAAVVLLSACRTPVTDTKAKAHAALAAAEAHLAAGRYTEALNACIDLSRENPVMPGLPELQSKVMARLTELRAREAALAAAQTHSRSAVDIDSRKRIPSTYGLDRFVEGQTNSLRSLPNSMEQILRKPISVHLDGVGLKDFVMAVAASDNINIITDAAIGEGSLTLHAEKVPFVEILDYISRNLGVTFFVGENLIWATAVAPTEPGPPLVTRMYQLRRGISNEEIENKETDIEKAIQQFVPKIQNATFGFIPKTHLLVVKDTRENLSLVETILERLDVCPRQILIESRFLWIMSDDYRDLGVDWIINSPIGITTETVLRNGTPVRANQTEIESRATLINPLARPPEDSTSGANLVYRGVLTDPMFRAVVRALERSGKARALAAPRVTTVNNRLAHIEDSLQEQYVETYRITMTQWTNNTPFVTAEPVPKDLKTGISLDVTPSVGADERTIAVKVVPTIRERLRWEDFPYVTQGTSNNMRYPVVSERKIETEVVVQTGETIVLGGLVKSTEEKKRTGMPILSSIPLLGRLFEGNTEDQKQENLLIFVTATILSDRGENLLPLNALSVALGTGGAAPASMPQPSVATAAAAALPAQAGTAPPPPAPPAAVPVVPPPAEPPPPAAAP